MSYDPPGGYYDISEKSKERACLLFPKIIKEASANNIDPTLLTALIIVESRFKPKAVSRSNACGLTQVIPKWTGGKATKRKKYTCDQLKVPETSIEAGASILSWWISHRKGNVRRGLCGYNAGFRGCSAGGRYADAVLKVQKHLLRER
tara:strand:- start:120 stop:563 length:444 start_codon:yes stop_codon:yes gene_type:complete